MTRSDLNKFRKALETTVMELEFSTRQRDAIVIENSADDLDRRLRACEREIAVKSLETDFAKLREARAALRRIWDGKFGTCLECEEQISPRRLAALPSAALCIRCQEAADGHCGAKRVRPVFAMAA